MGHKWLNTYELQRPENQKGHRDSKLLIGKKLMVLNYLSFSILHYL